MLLTVLVIPFIVIEAVAVATPVLTFTPILNLALVELFTEIIVVSYLVPLLAT